VGRPVVFVDTSVLCNLLGVPNKAQDRKQITAELVERRKSSDLVLPITAIIETGNHIAQIGDGYGNARRECAQMFARFIEMMIARETPWVLHSVEWDESYLRTLLDGGGTGSSLVDLATARFGCGDLSILVEVERYRARTAGVDVDVWTLDAQLASYRHVRRAKG
jgi:hypothetical protein